MRFAFPLVALFGLTLAAPSRRTNHVVHEKRAAEPLEWVKSRRLEAHKVLPMRFGLTQQNLHQIEDMLMAVSHPESLEYGQHWTPDKVVETFAPSDKTIAAVVDWLTSSGFSADRLRLSQSKGWIEVNATTAEVEELLDTEYHVYTHPSGTEQIGMHRFCLTEIFHNIDRYVGCHSYSLPADVREHVDLIKPTVHFNHRAASNTPLRKRSGPNLGLPSSRTGPKTNGVKVTITPSLENCDQLITLDCLRALYSIEHTPVSTKENTYGIGAQYNIHYDHKILIYIHCQVEFTPQSFLAPDLDLFFRYRADYVLTSFLCSLSSSIETSLPVLWVSDLRMYSSMEVRQNSTFCFQQSQN